MEKLTKSPRLNKLLYQMEIYNFYDVVNHLPRKYEDLHPSDESKLVDKQRITLVGKLMSSPITINNSKYKITRFEFLSNSRRYYRVVAFNRLYLEKILNLNDTFTLVGIYSKKNNEINFSNIYKGQISEDKMIKPIYSLPTDYAQNLFSSLVSRSLKELEGHIPGDVPFYFSNKYRLVKKETALKWAHFPESEEQVRQSLRYLKYEEALLFSLKNQIIKQDNKSLAKVKKEAIGIESCEEWLKTLPYQLSEDQRKAAEEIIDDMNQSTLMYRLLQGDVGSGKTFVSFVALYANYKRGDQGALMAPTDALARQHYENAKKFFALTNIKVALLIGSTPASEKRNIYQELEEGEIDIVIGTHALFAKAVKYSSLGLAIIDEQHRFGVNQRIMLADKGSHTDLLMMSATPIPRSLALTLYGDLDVSTLKSYPAFKREVVTGILSGEDERIYKYVNKALNENRQVYVVAPLIDFREDERYSVEKLFTRDLSKYHEKVGLLHGKMNANQKEEALEKFYNGTTPILVSTPVIEVGIDVRSASTMIIYDASNFGLASLHQLRGRIGRDGQKAYCILTLDSDEPEDRERLEVLVNSSDGFEIAEQDMKLRGPGELTGLKQSGMPVLKFLNIIDDYKIFVAARDDAKYIMQNPNNPGFSYIINKARREINKNPLIKG